MRRRTLLAAGAFLTSLSGCLNRGDISNNDDTSSDNESSLDDHPDTTVPLDSIETPSLGENCGPSELPLSALLTDRRRRPDAYDETCNHSSAITSLAIENERDQPIDVRVGIESADRAYQFDEEYTLESDQRIVEEYEISAHDDYAVTIDIEGGETVTGTWEGSSCFRRGIAILPDGAAIGYVEPFFGPGDASYDYYAGDDAMVIVRNGDSPQKLYIQIDDLCRDETVEKVMDIDPDGHASLHDLLTVGGVYEVTVEVEDGESATERFDKLKRPLRITISDYGRIRRFSHILLGGG